MGEDVSNRDKQIQVEIHGMRHDFVGDLSHDPAQKVLLDTTGKPSTWKRLRIKTYPGSIGYIPSGECFRSSQTQTQGFLGP